MRNIVYIAFDTIDVPKSLVGIQQYKTQLNCQKQVNRFNKIYYNGVGRYKVAAVELKLI